MSAMEAWLAFLVGVLQGVTEWLPISSSGQTLILLEGMDVPTKDALALAFFLHFGTLFAVVARLRGDVRDVVLALPRWRTDPLVRFLLVSTLVSLALGLALVRGLESFFEDSAGGMAVTAVVGVLLIVTGLVLRSAKGREGDRRVGDLGPTDSVILGIVQGLAALPGISRSGMTVSALLIQRVDADESLRLSFLMSVPVTIAVVLYEVVTWDLGTVGWTAVAAGVLGSFILGYATIEGLMRLSRRLRWDLFCMIFGAIAVVAGVTLIIL